jgi:hemin uptake protein HemP
MPSRISTANMPPGKGKLPSERTGIETGNSLRLQSDSLFQGASVLELEHNGQIYRLQITALNKLILTK